MLCLGVVSHSGHARFPHKYKGLNAHAIRVCFVL